MMVKRSYNKLRKDLLHILREKNDSDKYFKWHTYTLVKKLGYKSTASGYVLKVLHDLFEQGLVEKEYRGRKILWRLIDSKEE